MDSMNHLKSEDHMELMMMMQMDKHPSDFCGSNGDIHLNLSSLEFSGASGYFSKNLHRPTMASSASSPHSPPTVQFSDNDTLNHPQDKTQPPSLSPSSNTRSRWRKTGELSSIDAFAATMEQQNSMASMREMIFRIASMQPIHIESESVKPPKRRNVKISKDPQSVAARHRRERISERIRIMKRLVPGGTKMDTASMLEEAIHYVNFLKLQVQSLERASSNSPTTGIGFPVGISMEGGSSSSYIPSAQTYQNTPDFHVHDHYLDA